MIFEKKQTAQEIVNDIEAHFSNLGGPRNFSDLYIGITNDIERRLFDEHNVPKQDHWRICREAINDEHARAVEKHYLDKGMKGSGGGGDYSAKYVYCYEIATFTNE